ncbi:hypothetical protein [Cellulosimicrobium sp. NPDC055967]|uniref:hypothetical protein n=1 Tax=Cellulosimicrobium sp. NPDC055967 TaxID=3345670 RepID=UPI0035D6285F
MRYFATRATSVDVRLASTQDAENEAAEARASLERLGEDPDLWLSRALGGTPESAARREEDRRSADDAEAAAREDLAGVRRQAVSDARDAWAAADQYFAPVLFQPVSRDGERWERALHEIAEIGWRLQSWQVVGPAPEPFGSRVTLIQTLSVR